MTDGADGHAERAGTVRVVLCDDVAEMRQLLRWALDGIDDVEVAGEATDGEDAVALVAELMPHVVVLDLQMPGPAPAALLQQLVGAAPRTAIVTYSGFDPDLVAAEAAHLVARHVPKTTDLALVREAIVEVGRGAV
jgi:DNA-binding NarL/FixJ family response regulator